MVSGPNRYWSHVELRMLIGGFSSFLMTRLTTRICWKWNISRIEIFVKQSKHLTTTPRFHKIINPPSMTSLSSSSSLRHLHVAGFVNVVRTEAANHSFYGWRQAESRQRLRCTVVLFTDTMGAQGVVGHKFSLFVGWGTGGLVVLIFGNLVGSIGNPSTLFTENESNNVNLNMGCNGSNRSYFHFGKLWHLQLFRKLFSSSTWYCRKSGSS